MTPEKKLTGWHVFLGFAAAFGIIIAVNFTLAYKSVSTFPGLEVKNSYVASQRFETERDAMRELGWTSKAELSPERVVLELRDKSGKIVVPAEIDARIGRATHAGEDRVLELVETADGYSAAGSFGPGTWTLFLTAKADDGTLYKQRYSLVLREGA